MTLEIRTKALLFDMDGVLVSSIESVRRSWRQWAQHYGVPRPEEVEIPHGTRAVDVMRLLKPDIDVVEGLRRIEQLEIADVDGIRVLPGVQELLSGLPGGRWTIVTSATDSLALTRLQAAKLPVPPVLITAEMVERGKPDPEPYRRGAEGLGFPEGECIVVEDAIMGIQAGVAAGCRVLGVLGTYQADDLYHAGATWVVPSLAAVSAFMLNDEVVLRLTVEA